MAEIPTFRTPEIIKPSREYLEKMEKMWSDKPGIVGFFSTVDHKKIGRRYLVTAFIFLLVGGMEALIMRLQLAQPNESVVGPHLYNQLFSMHGITMIFLYAMPVLSGFGNYLWPLILGQRDMAFPRVNMFTYWTFLLSGIFLYIGLPTGNATDVGWFNYVPLAGSEYNPGPGVDIYALGIIFFWISIAAGSVVFIATMMRARAPGMSISRIPIMIWGTLTANVGLLFAVPSVLLVFIELWLDRRFGTDFFNASESGHPLLWQHLFWIFGHPWVYAIVLPAMSIVSQALPAHCRRPLVAHHAVILATILTMVLGFGVWVHHMFATGLPVIALGFFSAASFVIVIPSAVSVFAWVATIWTGRPVFTTAFKFFAAEIILFVIGGVSGFMTAAIPLDWQLTDTYFVVAHIHYVLIGINVFPVVGGIYHWFPKFTGKMLSEKLGWWNFWLMFIGFNVGFFPMHISGLLGMPRRIYTYPEGLGWGATNLVTTIGAFIFALGVLVFVFNVAKSLMAGKKAPANPWDADTLEWSTSSPPPHYNFGVIPRVGSMHPLWEDRLRMDDTGKTILDEGPALDEEHEMFGTTVLDADPDVILKEPGESFAPIIMALLIAGMFIGLLLEWWWISGAAVIAMFPAMLYWFWPSHEVGRSPG
ncbi:MAG TPA: cbb3-type cytochrome c oxidase subunit I [Gammaproteobacteria bacterium]|nr:cbb3-type cytochrome c oxidase subunit I [Gammaproteobacteria bacterium]